MRGNRSLSLRGCKRISWQAVPPANLAALLLELKSWIADSDSSTNGDRVAALFHAIRSARTINLLGAGPMK